MKKSKLVVAALVAILSSHANAAIIATSLVDDNGEWSTGNTANQFVPSPTAGLTATAGTDIMQFNSLSSAFNGPSSIVFPILLAAGTYTASIDVGSFDNRPLAEVATIGMFADIALLTPSMTMTPAPATGTWETWTFEYVILEGNQSIGTSFAFFIDVANDGVDANIAFDNLRIDYQSAVVPVPAAIWLFGSGLIGLAGVARRKSRE